jgi:hypothetical protein
MWICNNCDEVNQDDAADRCRTCNIDRNVIIDAKNQRNAWVCGSCGKKHVAKVAKCPICNTPRFVEETGRRREDVVRPPSAAEALAARLTDLLAGGGALKALAAVALLAVVGAGAWIAVERNRFPSSDDVKAGFVQTELARINGEFVADRPDAVEAAGRESAAELAAIHEMLGRLAADCGEEPPGAARMRKTRENIAPQQFENSLVKLAGAIDRYVAGRIGPIGNGYELKSIHVTGKRLERSGGETVCTVDYEAVMTARADVKFQRPLYLDGQDNLPLVQNDAIDWANYDRFYKSWLERNTERGRAAAAAFNRERSVRICAKGDTQSVAGKLTFEKTSGGWKSRP